MKTTTKCIIALIGILAVIGIYCASTYEHGWQKVDRFHNASSSGDLKMLAASLEELGDPDVVSLSGATALHEAVIAGQIESAEFLLSHGADLNIKDSRGQTPLHYAVRNASAVRSKNHVALTHDPQPLGVAMIKLLRNHNGDVTVKDEDGRTPADWARVLGYEDLLGYLQ